MDAKHTGKNFFFIDDSGSRNWDNAYLWECCVNPPDRDPDNVQYWRENYFRVIPSKHNIP